MIAAISIEHDALAMFVAILPLALIFVAVCIVFSALAMFDAIIPLALIFGTVYIVASAEAMFEAMFPLAFIHLATVCKVDGSVTITSVSLPHAIVSFIVFKVASA
jgi:hypothetical protein